MCGLVFKYNFDGEPVNNDVLQQFDMQRKRGVEGFGLFDGQEKHIVKATKEDKILKWLCKYDSNLIMFHHRFPTSTDNVKRAAHPFSTKDYFGNTQYILVHNGVVSNAKELKPKHDEMGITYSSTLQNGKFNDSEALLWDVALTLEGKQTDPEAIGGVAFICVKMIDGVIDSINWFRNWNKPLFVYKTDNSLSMSSEGTGVEVAPNTISTFNYATRDITTTRFVIEAYKPSTSPVLRSQPARSPQPAYVQRTFDDWDYETGGYNPHVETQSMWGTEGHGGDWLPDIIKSKVGKFMGVNPAGETYYSSIEDDGDDYDEYDEDEVEKILAESTSDPEVASRTIEYLMANQGRFDEAYWNAERDYEMVLADESANYYEIIILENVLEEIESDPEFTSINSVSSMWRAIC